jgi:hypothetical protein
MAITVPATAIDGKTPSPIPVTPNPKARFDIAQTVADETAFAAFAQRVNNGEYALSGKLTGNINVPSAATYIPIARPVMGEDEKLIFNPYTGTLDGNGNTVTIDLTGDASFLSLVAHNNGTIMNLIVAGKVKADIPTPLPSPDFSIDYIAGVVAYNDIYGLIERVISKVTVDAKDNETHCIGGIAGFNDWDQYNDDSPHAGKDPGDQESRGTIRQCRNEGEVLGGFNKIGGIVGENAGDVIECANIGTITVHKDGRGWPGVGGIVGRDGNNNTPTEKGGIENCRNAGDITESDPMGNAENAFGSIAGYSDDLGTIKGCLAVGKFIERRGQKNPIVGMVDEDAPDKSVNNYALDSIFKTSDKTALIGIPKTEEYMKSQEFVDEINAAIGSNVYAKDPDGGFPKLAWEVGLSAPDPKDGQKKN